MGASLKWLKVRYCCIILDSAPNLKGGRHYSPQLLKLVEEVNFPKFACLNFSRFQIVFGQSCKNLIVAVIFLTKNAFQENDKTVLDFRDGQVHQADAEAG